jgi:hypothetical protein
MMKFSKEKNQETILAIVLGLLVIWYFTGLTVLIYISLGLVITAIFSQSLSGIITFLWLKLSHIMGYVMSRVILSMVFFLFLFPIALLARTFSKNSLQLKKMPEGQSYYQERNHTYTKGDLENPW